MQKTNGQLLTDLIRHDLFHVIYFIFAVLCIVIMKLLNVVTMVTNMILHLLINLENMKLEMLKKCKCIIVTRYNVIVIWAVM